MTLMCTKVQLQSVFSAFKSFLLFTILQASKCPVHNYTLFTTIQGTHCSAHPSPLHHHFQYFCHSFRSLQVSIERNSIKQIHSNPEHPGHHPPSSSISFLVALLAPLGICWNKLPTTPPESPSPSTKSSS